MITIFTLTVILSIGTLVSCSTLVPNSHGKRRQVWAWASVHATGRNNSKEVLIAQLQNTTLASLVDGIQVWCGDCRFEKEGIFLNDTFWEDQCMPVVYAAKAANVKFQLMIQGAVPAAAIQNPKAFSDDALSIIHKHNLQLLVDGFSIDDERDCAPRATTDSFRDWVGFQNSFAADLAENGLRVTSAVQALYAIENDSSNNPCKYNPAQYDQDTTVSDLLQVSTKLKKWLVMDTYYFSTGRFMGALDWHLQYIPLPTLAIGMMNRDDLTEDGLVARFHALHHSRVDWINIFMMPIDEKLLPFLQRWKTYCMGCGKQSILGCYDMSIECKYNDIALVDGMTTTEPNEAEHLNFLPHSYQ